MKSHINKQANNKKPGVVRANFIINENPAKNFTVISKGLEEYAKENNIPLVEVINDMIADLENWRKEGYDKRLKCFNIVAITPQLRVDLINQLKRARNNCEEKARQDKKNKGKETINDILNEIEKEMDKAILDGKSEVDVIVEKELDISQDGSLSSKEKKSILKKLAERKKEIEAREVAKAKANQAIEEIKEIVDREFAEGNIETRAMYLKSIESEVRDTNKIDGEARQYLLEMISGRIKEEIYYEQVEEFTNGFQFLSEYPELVNATSGFRKRKFTDRESYDRFCDLRIKLQAGLSEYSQVNRLLEDKRISGTDKRILEARKSVIDKESAKRRGREGR